MTKGKVGRNDICPCGSGKKYKRCCLGARDASPRARALGESSAADRLAVLGVDGLRILAELNEGGQDALVDSRIQRCGELLAPGGPLAHVRFDEEPFRAALEHLVEAAGNAQSREREGRREQTPPWLAAFRRAADSLAPPPVLDRMTNSLLAVLAAGSLSRHDWDAVATLVLPSVLALDARPWEPATVPLLELVYHVQLGEHFDALPGTMRELDAITARFRESGSSAGLDDLDPSSPLSRAMRERLRRDPLAVASMSLQFQREAQAAIDKVGSGDMPEFVAVDEFAYLSVILNRAVADQSRGGRKLTRETVGGVIEAIEPMIMEHLFVRWTDRLYGWVTDPSCPVEQKQALEEALVAAACDVGRLGFALVRAGDIWWRSDAEMAALEPAIEEKSILRVAEASATWLRAQGLDDTLAAQAVALAQESDLFR